MKNKTFSLAIFLTLLTLIYLPALSMNKTEKNSKKKLLALLPINKILNGSNQAKDDEENKSPLSPKSFGKKREQKFNTNKRHSLTDDIYDIERTKEEIKKENIKNKQAITQKETLDKQNLEEQAHEEIYNPEREDSIEFYSSNSDEESD